MFPGYKQGYKAILVLNLGKMPGKRYTNKDIIERLDEIERKTTLSFLIAMAFAMITIGVACWGISFVGISNLDLRWHFAGWIFLSFGYIIFVFGFLRLRKTKR